MVSWYYKKQKKFFSYEGINLNLLRQYIKSGIREKGTK